jgi:uncharacterized protein DUF4388
MSLTGTLSTMSLPDLLQWLHQSRKSGTLVLRGDRHAKRLYFSDGDISSSSSDDPTEYLGQFLLSHGLISEADLQRGMEVQKQTGVLLGRILIMVGTISEDDLKRYLVMKAEETVFSVFLWDDAHFEFRDGEQPAPNLVPINVRIDDILLKGLSRYDELRRVKEVFGTTLTVVARTGTAPGPEFLSSARRRAVWDCIDGVRSIADVALALHMADFIACEVIHLLFQMGHVRIAQRVTPDAAARLAPPAPRITDALSDGRRLFQDGKLEEALDLVERAAVEEREQAPALRALLKEVQEAYVDKTYRYQMPPDRVPLLLKQLDELTQEPLTPEEGFLISRINGEWTIRDVVSIAPLSEIDALRTLRRLRQRGIIDLK